MQRKFFDLIREENARGVTVFFSSHILGEVQRLCTRVGIIREGKIVEISDIRSLQQNNYKKIGRDRTGRQPGCVRPAGRDQLPAGRRHAALLLQGRHQRRAAEDRRACT